MAPGMLSVDLEEWRFSEQLSFMGSSGKGLVPWGSILSVLIFSPSTLKLSMGTEIAARG